MVGYPRRLNGEDNDQSAIVRELAEHLRRLSPLPLHLQDERLSSREADSGSHADEKDWRKRKAQLDAASAAIILQDYLDGRALIQTTTVRSWREARVGASRCAARVGDPSARDSGHTVRSSNPTRASARKRPSSRSRPARAAPAWPPGWREAGVVRNAHAFPARRLDAELGPPPPGGRVPLRPADDPDRGRRQDRARRRLPAVDHLPGRPDHPADGRALRGEGIRTCRELRGSCVERRQRSRRSIPRRSDLEGYLFPDTYALPRRATADTLVDRMVDGVREGADAGAARAGDGARPRRARARDAGVDRREGDRQARGAAARRRGLQRTG